MVGDCGKVGEWAWDEGLCLVVRADLCVLEEDMRCKGSEEAKRMQRGGECFELKGRFDEWQLWWKSSLSRW